MPIVVMRIRTSMRRRIRWKLKLPRHPSQTTTITTKHRRTQRVISWIGTPKELMMTVILWWTKTGPLVPVPREGPLEEDEARDHSTERITEPS